MLPEAFSHHKIAIAENLLSVAQNILAIAFGLLPIFFIPNSAAPFAYSKVLFVVAGLLVAVIFYSLSVLRSGKIPVRFPLLISALLLVALGALVSSLLSGDLHDSFIGTLLDTHSALFVGILALVALVWMVLGTNKKTIMRFFLLISASTLILVLFHVSRLFFGPGFLSLGIFGGAPTLSPIGSWNDLGIFLGLTIILSLVALEQLSLTKWGRALFAAVALGSLLMLALINFFMVWVVLGFVSLVVVGYALSKDRLASDALKAAPGVSVISLSLSLVVLIVSIIFVTGGAFFSNMLGEATGISYVEVRPSLEATTDIAKEVYKEQALFGIGPNKFVDAWRLYKDPSLNSTIFWNTDFLGGIGYIPTLFVTTGIVGAVLWIIFLSLFLTTGFRTLIHLTESDRLWRFIATASFAGGLYLWFMSVVYIPGVVILLLAALFTGLVGSSYYKVTNKERTIIEVGKNRSISFIFIAGVMLVIVCSIFSLYFVARHYAAAYTFISSVKIIETGRSIDDAETTTARAFALSPDDAFARRIAEYQLARMVPLLRLQNPTSEQQAEFQLALSNGLNAADQAVQRDNTNADNWGILGNIYSILVSANVDGAYERAKEALERARQLDPINPVRPLALAQLESARGNTEEARSLTESAIRLKRDYGDAIFFLSQIDIAAGNIEGAIEATNAIISLEPRNPVRYYQLGLLEISRNNIEAAQAALERAVGLSETYSNARYFLGMTYAQLDRTEDARAQFERILQLNPGNQDVIEILRQLDEGTAFREVEEEVSEQVEQPVPEEPAATDDTSVTDGEVPDSPLLTPVNRTGDETEDNNQQ